MLKRITITVSEEAARWARRKAAEENTSVSNLVGRMLEDQMRRTDEYWAAYEKWKKIRPPSRPREFRPEPLTDPDLSLSTHPARATP